MQLPQNEAAAFGFASAYGDEGKPFWSNGLEIGDIVTTA
jgi:hypothetical protein